MGKITLFNGKYSLSRDGTITNKDGHIMKPEVLNNGYLRVTLYDEYSKPMRYMVHILVAQYFIPNPDNLPQVNHKDCNKLNCNDWNLEWCTQSDNIKHAIDNGLYVKQLDNQRLASKASALIHSKPVLQIDIVTGETVKEYINKYDASKQVNGTTPANIKACCDGKRNLCGGFRWSYKKGDD